MASFLTTRKMPPALVARIERSIGASYRHDRPSAFAPRLGMSALRVGLMLALVTGTYAFVRARHQYAEELESARARLLDAVHAQNAQLTANEKNFVSKVQPFLVTHAGAYAGDFVAADLRTQHALESVLARPSVYVRGPIAAFANTSGIESAAAASSKDSFLVCLLDPPTSRTEKALLGKVRGAYGGDALVLQRIAHGRRLHDAIAGLGQLRRPWEERVRGADKVRELDEIRTELGRVPLEKTKRAVQAEVLIAAMDEPDEAGPADLDGERAHHVRIGIVEIAASRVLLRARHRVDPSWISVSTRSTFASAVDGCALALDVRASVKR